MPQPLYVFAIEAEMQGLFDQMDVLCTGVGKVQAAYALARRIAEKRPSLIVNLGTAGSNRVAPGSVVHCRQFVQRDMDATPLGYAKGITPFSNVSAVLYYGLTIAGLPEAVCGTGDNFATHTDELAYDIVDMESYALAYVAMREQIPFACLKYISDGMNDESPTDWSHALRKAATALADALSKVALT